MPELPSSFAAVVASVNSGFDAGSLIEGFRWSCANFPQRVALVCGGERLTYAELSRETERMAERLGERGLTPGSLAAIFVERSPAMIVSMLAVLRRGCAYLPIDPTYPAARVRQTLEDATPALVITERGMAGGLALAPERLFFVEEEAVAEAGSGAAERTVQRLPGDRPTGEERASAAEDLAYVMYTSGSTGRPKGVLVTQGNVLRLFRETQGWFGFNEHDVWTMFHSFAFDFSVWEIWGPLLTGGRLVIVPFALSRSPEEFRRLLSSEGVTVLNQTPSAFSLLDAVEAGSGEQLPMALRVVIFGGEALPYRSLRGWFRRHGDERPQLVNMYGITETTVHVTYRRVRERDAEVEGDSLIGEPIPDLQLYLLDEAGRPVPDGETGEICVGGGGVARGYLNRPELTEQRFVPDPVRGGGARMYRSGDLARRRADGELVYLRRNDGQLKVNGFRVELGEVEAAVAASPEVRQACVVAHAETDGRYRLAAYVVPWEGGAISVAGLRAFLAERCPAHQVPSFFTVLPALPLTGNGKVDRAALPKPVATTTATGGAERAAAAARGSDMEETIAAVWRETLGLPEVGLDDNFFDLGGTSFLLITAQRELGERLGRSLPMVWMFSHSTVRSLAAKLAEEEAAAGAGTRPAAPMVGVQDQARRQREALARMRTAKGGTR